MPASRRQFMQTSLGLGAAAALPLIAGCGTFSSSDIPGALIAGARPSGRQLAEGVYRARIGSIKVLTLSDGFARFPLTADFVRNASLEQVRQALRDAGQDPDTITIPFTAALVEYGGRRILIDAGNGQFGPETAGKLPISLRAAGLEPKDIDAILISHFHSDHIGGLRDRDGMLTYPNAKILVPAAEWAYWMDDARMAAAPASMQGAFQNVRRVFAPIEAQVQRFAPDVEVLPGVHSIAAYGHTPGHTAFTMQSGGQTWAYLGDVTNIAALFMRNPDWAVRFDMDPDLARQTRHRLLDKAVAEAWLVSGYHLPPPAIGRVARRGAGFDFTPMT